MSGDETPEDPGQAQRPLVAIKGDASPEEVAALVAVVQAMAASADSVAEPRRRSVWADPARQMRRPHHAGPGGWTRSALPG